MVGGEEHEQAVFPDFAFEQIEQQPQIVVEAQVRVLDLDGIGAVGVSNIVGGGERDGQKIRRQSFAEAFAHQCGGGGLNRERIAEGRGANQVARVGRLARRPDGGQVVRKYGPFLAGQQGFPGHVVGSAFGVRRQGEQRRPGAAQQRIGPVVPVEIAQPRRQFLRVKRAGDERATGAVEPEGTRRKVPGRQDGAPVFQAHAHDLALDVGKPQLVGDGGREQIAGRLLPRHRRRRAHGLRGRVFGDIDVAPQFARKPVVAHDAVAARPRARVHGRVAGAGVGRHVVVVAVRVLKTLPQQALEAAVGAVFAPVAIQKIVAHLVHHQPHRQPRAWQRPLRRKRLAPLAQRQPRQKYEQAEAEGSG